LQDELDVAVVAGLDVRQVTDRRVGVVRRVWIVAALVNCRLALSDRLAPGHFEVEFPRHDVVVNDSRSLNSAVVPGPAPTEAAPTAANPPEPDGAKR